MRRIRLLVLGILLVAGAGIAAFRLTAQPAQPAQPAPALDSQEQRVSYAIGLNLGRSLAAQKIKTDFDVLARGIRDGLGGTSLLDDKQIQETMEAFERDMRSQLTATGEKNRTDGAAFLAENAKRPGVKTTASGLQYEIVTAGDGPKPSATDRVKVHYKGSLRDGTEFDSSISRGEPASFHLNRVVPCWTEGVQKMKVGGKARLVCPAELGYGERGVPGRIPAGAALVFEVELLEILPEVAARPRPTGKPGDEPAAAGKPAAKPAPKPEAKPAPKAE